MFLSALTLSFLLILIYIYISKRKIFTFGNGLTQPIRAGKLRMSLPLEICPPSVDIVSLKPSLPWPWFLKCWVRDRWLPCWQRKGGGQKEVAAGNVDKKWWCGGGSGCPSVKYSLGKWFPVLFWDIFVGLEKHGQCTELFIKTGYLT